MIAIIIKSIFGLFIWMVVPNLLFQKKSKKKAPSKRFANIVCTGLGIIILAIAGLDLIKLLLNFR